MRGEWGERALLDRAAVETGQGAGHAFFATDRPAYRVEAALDGYRRIGEFFAHHLG